MPGETICLDCDVWTEVPDRTIIKAGTVYVGKDFIPDQEGKPLYEVRVYVRKIMTSYKISDIDNIENLISNQPGEDLKSAFAQIYRALNHINCTTTQFGEIQYVAHDAMMMIIGSIGMQYTSTKVPTEKLVDHLQVLFDLKMLCNNNGTIATPHHLLTKPR